MNAQDYRDEYKLRVEQPSHLEMVKYSDGGCTSGRCFGCGEQFEADVHIHVVFPQEDNIVAWGLCSEVCAGTSVTKAGIVLVPPPERKEGVV